MCFTLSASFIPQHSRRLYFVQGQDLGKSRYDTGAETILSFWPIHKKKVFIPNPYLNNQIQAYQGKGIIVSYVSAKQRICNN